MESTYIGAYWGNRSESSLECGQRLAECIAGLSKADPVLGSWFQLGASKAAAKTPVAGDAVSLGALLEQSRSKDDLSGDVIEELGFSIGLWNRAEPMVSLGGTVGSFPSVPGLLNSIVLDFPPPDTEGRRLHSLDVASSIFESVVKAWQPEWATWTTAGLRDAQAAEPRVPVLGWLTYLRGEIAHELPVGVMKPMGDGALVQAAQDFAEVDEKAVDVIRQHLDHSAALRPIPLPG